MKFSTRFAVLGLAVLIPLTTIQIGWMSGTSLAQGLISVEPDEDGKVVDVTRKVGNDNAARIKGNNDKLTVSEAEARRLSTIQRMLLRLGFLKSQPTQILDEETREALDKFSRSEKLRSPDVFSEEFLRVLFLAVWNKGNWDAGNVDGVDLVVDKKKIREAQIALRDLKYDVGPSDGVFGPSTFTAIEVFQQANGMKVTGILSTNMYDAILRASANRDIDFKGTVRVLNWTDYMNPETLVQFERDTGFKVIQEVFASLEDSEQILQDVEEPFDLVIKPGYSIRDMVEKKRVQSIDLTALKNYKLVDPAINTITSTWDPSNSYVVPYLWGTVGVVVDRDKVEKRLGREIWSWDLVLDAENAEKLNDCGIVVVDSSNDIMTAMVGAVVDGAKELNIATVAKLKDKFSKVDRFVEVVDSERYIDRVASGDACVAVGYSGDALQALNKKSSKSSRLNFFIPEEGSIVWFDYFMLSNESKSKDAAMQFLDFIMRPDIAGQNTNYVQYANAIVSASAHIDKDLLENPAIYPPKSVFEKLSTVNPVEPSLQTEIENTWKIFGE